MVLNLLLKGLENWYGGRNLFIIIIIITTLPYDEFHLSSVVHRECEPSRILTGNRNVFEDELSTYS